MRAEEFHKMLAEAIAGNHQALALLLRLYMPLIYNHSYINDKFDEDLRQYILMHIALNISKFIL